MSQAQDFGIYHIGEQPRPATQDKYLFVYLKSSPTICTHVKFQSFRSSSRALDKLYFQKSTVLVHFLKKRVTRNFWSTDFFS